MKNSSTKKTPLKANSQTLSPIPASTFLSTLSSNNLSPIKPSTPARTCILYGSRVEVIQQLQQMQIEKSEEIKRLSEQLSEEERKYKSAVSSSSSLIKERNENIDKLNQTLNEQDLTYKDLIVSKDNTISELNQELVDISFRESRLIE